MNLSESNLRTIGTEILAWKKFHTFWFSRWTSYSYVRYFGFHYNHRHIISYYMPMIITYTKICWNWLSQVVQVAKISADEYFLCMMYGKFVWTLSCSGNMTLTEIYLLSIREILFDRYIMYPGFYCWIEEF